MSQNGTVLTIDLEALGENYQRLKSAAKAPNAAGVIKANGYGLGIEQVGRTLARAGAREFFVANVDEGITLRAALGTDAVIYIIGGILSGVIGSFKQYNLIPVLNALSDIEAWKQQGGGHPCVIHFDTGMNRLGLPSEETARVIEEPDKLNGLNLIMGMSHFASSEDLKDGLNDIQIKRFRAITSALTLPRWSFCNTAAIYLFPHDQYDLVRCGYGLYGGNPLPHTDNPMRPVVSLSARILQTKKVKAGESIGYNATFAFDTDDEIAVAALGYADGYLRSQSSKGYVYWNGQPCLITGRVSMDLTTFRIGHIQGQKPQAGDMVEILGPHQGVDALAAGAGTNGYEILTRLGSRYTRVYKGGD